MLCTTLKLLNSTDSGKLSKDRAWESIYKDKVFNTEKSIKRTQNIAKARITPTRVTQ